MANAHYLLGTFLLSGGLTAAFGATDTWAKSPARDASDAASTATSDQSQANAELPKAALLPMEANRIPQDVVRIMDAFLASELDAADRYQIIGTDDINAMLGFERMKDVVGCSDVACAAEIGGALGVSHLFFGKVGRLGDELILSLTLIDIEAPTVLARGRATVRNDERHYRRAIQVAVADVLDLPPPAQTDAPNVRDRPKRAGSATSVSTDQARQPGPRSPSQFRVSTMAPEHQFSVVVVGSDGSAHECPDTVSTGNACTLDGMSVGEALVNVTSPELGTYRRELDFTQRGEVVDLELMEFPGITKIALWATGGGLLIFGGMMAIPGWLTDIGGFRVAAYTLAGLGGAMIGSGFFFGNMVVGNERRINAPPKLSAPGTDDSTLGLTVGPGSVGVHGSF